MSFRLRKSRAKVEPRKKEKNTTISIPMPIRKYSGGNIRQTSVANSQAAMKRVFSIFSFSGQYMRKNSEDEDVDALIFDDNSEKAETDSILSDNSLTTFGDLNEQEAVGTIVKRPHNETNAWTRHIELGYEPHATRFLHKLIIEPQRKAYSQGHRSSSAVVKVDTAGSTVRNSKLLVRLPSLNKEKSHRSLLSVDDFQLDILEEYTEILKLDLYSVIARADIGKLPAVILTDLFWAAFGLHTENEVKLSDAHIIVRFFFQEAIEGNFSELAFQLLNTSRTGILSLQEVNEFVAHACSQSLDSLALIPAARKLFKRYLKYLDELENLEFFLYLFPYVTRSKDGGFIDATAVQEIYKLYLAPDAAYGINIPEKVRKPVNDYFEGLEGEEVDGMTYDVFHEAYAYVKQDLEKRFLPKFIKKIKRSNRLATKLFQSINASPVPGLEYMQFRKLLRVCPPLKEHCERCLFWMQALVKAFTPPKGSKEDVQFNEINTHIFKRRIPI